jgi:Flp pilus assembly protein TadD
MIKNEARTDRPLWYPRDQNSALIVVICIFLAAITWSVFGQTLWHGFLNYDDDSYVYANPIVTSGITVGGVAWAFTHSHARNWHPLTTISHMLDCQLFGLKAGGHHFSNVLLHTAAVILLFLVLHQITAALWRSAFVAAVFAIHPLRVESVAWIAERKDVLSGVFFILTLAAYLRYVRKQTPGRYAMLAISFACGLMTKPMLVTVPFVLLLLDYWPLQRMVDLETLRRVALEKVPLFVLSALSSVATILAQGGPTGEMEPFPLAWRLDNAVVTYLIYIRQMFWPSHLAVFYPHPESGFPVSEIILATAILVAITGVAFALRRTRPYFIVGWFWYLGMLVPVIGVLQIGMQGHSDRYTYLPQIGLYILLTWAIADLFHSWRYRRSLLAIGATIVLVTLSRSAQSQIPNWHDSESLWRRALAVTSNNPTAHNNLGVLLQRRGQLDEAIFHYGQALDIRSNSGQARHYLGLAHAHSNLGSALLRKGQIDDAIAQCEMALKLRPAYADAHTNLGNALLQKGFVDQAILHYEKALQTAPASTPTLNNLAQIFATSSDPQFRNGARAIQLAEQADQLTRGQNPAFARTLAAAYAENGRFNDAVNTAERALKRATTQDDLTLRNDIRLDIDLYRLNLPRRSVP